MKHIQQNLILIGAGKMGLSLLIGWLKGGFPPSQISVVEPYPSEELHAIAKATGIKVHIALPSSIANAIVILAIKPQMAKELLAQLAKCGTPELLISIMAGTSMATLSENFSAQTAVVRTMPNTPAAIGQGVTAALASQSTTQNQRTLTEQLFAPTGKWLWLENEDQINAVTALSGSGPAYVFALCEAMALGGEILGLTSDQSQMLARQTIIGAAALLQQSDQSAQELRESVTSPNGTTAAALNHLQDAHAGLPPLLAKAMVAAKTRAEQLS